MAINTTTSTQTTTYLNKTWYDKSLLEWAKTKQVHARYGQKRKVPAGQGKKVEFRGFEPFDPADALTALTEGVTPEGQDLTQRHVEVTCAQYGRHVEVSDLLKTTAYDDVMGEAAELLGEQLGTVIDWVTRDAMCAGTNVQYAGGKTARNALLATDKLTTVEIRKAVRTLKKKKAKMFNTNDEGKIRRPHYVCICSPDATFDLQDDEAWEKVSYYNNAEAIYSGEIGRLFNVVFVESTEAKVFSQSVYTTVVAHSAGSADVQLAAVTDAAAAYLKPGAKLTIGDTAYTVASLNRATATVTLSETVSNAIAAGTKAYSVDAGALDGDKCGADVHATLVFGQNAYGCVDIDGGGNVEMIVHGLGTAGSADPLNQRATVGAKINAYAATILNGDWLVRIEHGVSA